MNSDDQELYITIANSHDEIATCLELAELYCNSAIQQQNKDQFLRSFELFDFAVALLKYKNLHNCQFIDALIGRAIVLYNYAKTFDTQSKLVQLDYTEHLLRDVIAHLLSYLRLAIDLLDEAVDIDIAQFKRQLSELQYTRIADALETIVHIRQLRSGQLCTGLQLLQRALALRTDPPQLELQLPLSVTACLQFEHPSTISSAL